MVPNRRHQHGKASVQAPLSAHPAFPPIVALWFGALFGLGSMVMPAVVLETAARLTGLAAIFPQAEPPLGATARALIALLATLLGLGAGWLLARRLATAQELARPPRRTRAAAPEPAPRRPISAHEELGGHGIDNPAQPQRPPIAGRRRALTVTDEELPSEYLQYAPLAEHVPVPGGEPQAAPAPAAQAPFSPAEEPAMTDRPIDPAAPSASDELDLTRFAPPSMALPEPHQPPAGAQVFGAPPIAPAPEPAAEPIAAPAAYVPELDTRKPRAFAAPATPAFDPPAPEPVAHEAAPAAGIDGALDGMGLVQLIERLGRSLQRRPAPSAEPEADPIAFAAPSFEHTAEAAVAVPPPVVPEGLQAFMAEPAAPVATAETPAFAPPAPAEPANPVPSALRPFAFDHADEADEEHLDPGPFTLPLGSMSPRPFDAPAAASAPEPPAAPQPEPEDEDDALSEADGGYSSLLAMKNPFRAQPEFVRIDEPEPEEDAIEPAVVFPGQETAAAPVAAPEPEEAPANLRPFDAPHQPAPSTAPARARAAADAGETDRVLRSALANLQRMSGAA